MGTFDLSQLVTVAQGETVAHTPVAPMLPAYSARGREALERMLVLSFVAGEAVCIWFSTEKDCDLCGEALMNEAARAREMLQAEEERNAAFGSGVRAWARRLFGGPPQET